ncbi:MAG TPA: hypothetical protein VKX16_08445 [Chloroflexota bacterium]|nr:hypothetical protein [Chloroflexota bacterium]
MRQFRRIIAVGALAVVPVFAGIGGVTMTSGIVRADTGGGGGPDTCFLYTASITENAQHTQLYIEFKTNGVQQIHQINVLKLTNGATESNTPLPSPDVIVTLTKTHPGSVHFEIQAVEKPGCQDTVEPVLATLSANHAQTFHHIAASEHRVRIFGGKGITSVRIQVNGHVFTVAGHGSRLLNVARAMRGNNNTIRALAIGKAGSSTSILIGNS